VSVHFPYRAVICGEEHIVKGWRGRKLVTDKGRFSVRHLYGDWQIQAYRLFEVALIQPAGNDDWLLNGKPLSLLKSLPMGARLAAISGDETLRVHKAKVCAVAWIQTSASSAVTQLLDAVLESWKQAAQPRGDSQGPLEAVNESVLEEETDRDRLLIQRWREQCEKGNLFLKPLEAIANVLVFQSLSAGWSKPIWLTEFRSAGKKASLSPEQRKFAKLTQELEAEREQRRKAETAAGDTLGEALSKWMRFEPLGMAAETRARIEKAVKLYVTEPDKHSLAKIAAEFKVSRKTVSGWFKTFTRETGHPVVTHRRHESVREHLQADSEQEEEE
jgi:AraC-like DNA-binding protein